VTSSTTPSDPHPLAAEVARLERELAESRSVLDSLDDPEWGCCSYCGRDEDDIHDEGYCPLVEGISAPDAVRRAVVSLLKRAHTSEQLTRDFADAQGRIEDALGLGCTAPDGSAMVAAIARLRAENERLRRVEEAARTVVRVSEERFATEERIAPWTAIGDLAAALEDRS
jgi:hypothetical protein